MSARGACGNLGRQGQGADLRVPWFLAALLGAALAWPAGAWAAGMTKEQGDAILSELKEIRALLERQQAQLRAVAPQAQPAAAAQPPARPATAKVSIENAPSMGKADAPLTLVEFADYQCPFCTRFHESAFEELKKNYIDTGLVRFVSRDLPLPFHGEATNAARAARCAGEQQPDAYWKMRHQLLVNSSTLSKENMVKYAQELALDAAGFQACLDSDKYQAEVQRDLADANAAGLSGTPSFVLGKTSGDTVEGPTIIGARPYAAFESQIKQLLPAD